MAQRATKTPAPATAPKAPSGPVAVPTVANAPPSRSNRGMASLFRLARSSAAPPPTSNLTISSPTDPAELEAERIAGEVMRMPTPAGPPPPPSTRDDEDPQRVRRQIAPAAPVLHRACAACDDEKKVHRSATGDGPGTAPPIVGQVLSRPGQPLPDSARNFFEPRLGADLSRVRVHTDSQAARSAEAVQAKAYTVGSSIAFADGQYAPQSGSGKELLAHELVHVVQQGNSARQVQRDGAGIDPADTGSWSKYGSEEERKKGQYQQDVTAAGTKAGEMQKELGEGQAPQTDEEKEAFRLKVRTLIRLKAVQMMGQHRAGLESQKATFIQLAEAAANPVAAGGAPAESGAAQAAQAVRNAATAARILEEKLATLEGLLSTTWASVTVTNGPGAIPDELRTLQTASADDVNDSINGQFAILQAGKAGSLGRRPTKGDLLDFRNQLLHLRKRQIGGVQQSQVGLYTEFPYLAALKPDDILGSKDGPTFGQRVSQFFSMVRNLGRSGPAYGDHVVQQSLNQSNGPNDASVVQLVRDAFDQLLVKTDDALVKVAREGMDPFDLPGAIAAVRAGLPVPQQQALMQLVQDREVRNFTVDMLTVFGIAVLVGISGGLAAGPLAVAAGAGAAGLGAAQTVNQVDNVMDRRTVTGASTRPDGEMLGVKPPDKLDYILTSISVLLMAIDLAVLSKQLGALRIKPTGSNIEPKSGGGLHSGDVPVTESTPPSVGNSQTIRLEPGGAGPDSGPGIPHKGEFPHVAQSKPDWCGAACGEMAAGRLDVKVSQEQLAASKHFQQPMIVEGETVIPGGFQSPGLGQALQEAAAIPGRKWLGGTLNYDLSTPVALRQNLKGLINSNQSSVILRVGGGKHWIIVDQITGEGMLVVRDPGRGMTLVMTADEVSSLGPTGDAVLSFRSK